jgi:hypothetical protein
MSAVEALKQARAAGIRVGVDGDGVVLSGSEPPRAEIRELLARHKDEILTLLRRGDDGLSVDDWRVYFERSMHFAEIRSDLPRSLAHARAFACCLGEWMHRNPIRSPPGRCDLCGESNDLLLPFLTGSSLENPGHTWLHDKCSRVWHQKRRATAVSALLAMGISACVAPGSLVGG